MRAEPARLRSFAFMRKPAVAIVPAGGAGTRFGSGLPKQFVEIGGETILERTFRSLARSGVLDYAVVAAPAMWLDRTRAIAQRAAGLDVRVVEGGPTRQESVANAVAAAGEAALFAVHDAVRPFFTPALLRRLLEALDETDGAIPGMPLTETIHRMREGLIESSPSREQWVAAQTPQCFRAEVLRTCLRRAAEEGFVGTDEAGLASRYGYRVRVLPGEPGNVKITVPRDLQNIPEEEP